MSPPTPSLNRQPIIAVEGVSLPEGVGGKTAWELLSAAALAGLVRGRAGVLGLDAGLGDRELLPRFNALLARDGGRSGREAAEVAAEYGRRLGYLLLVLRQGLAANRAARGEWQESHWAYWGRLREVWLGGGLASGALGARIARAAQGLLQEAGVGDMVVRLSPYGAALALVGGARYAPADASDMVVFDFGHTEIKRAVAHYEGGVLVRMTPLVALPAGCEPVLPPEAGGRRQVERVLAVLEGTWREAQGSGPKLAPQLVACLAAYLCLGHPRQPERGCYDPMGLLCGHLPTFLSEQLSERLGRPVRVRLMHDGQAAASVHGQPARSLVVMLGTSLGVGQVLPVVGLRPVGNEVRLSLKKLGED